MSNVNMSVCVDIRLHCMPIVAKDDYDHVDLPTTSASVVFADCFPSGTSPVITAVCIVLKVF